MESNQISDTTQVSVKMVLDVWHMQNSRMDKLLSTLTDDQLAAQAAPGRNTGIYLLGHLTAVSDRLLETMAWGDRMYPNLDQPFLFSPDKKDAERPSAAELRECWSRVNETINKHIAAMSTEDWFKRHMSVSEEDFKKEPHRNRLNLLLSRAIHISNHQGQMLYLGALHNEN